MKKIMHFLFLSCMKAAGLIDKKAEVKLSWKENLQLLMHKSMCDACTAYEKQSLLLDKALHRHLHDELNGDLPIIENPNLKDRLQSKL